MKVDIKEVFFNTISKGDTFLFEGNAYIKSTIEGMDIAVNLSTGECIRFRQGDSVILCKMKVVVANE